MRRGKALLWTALFVVLVSPLSAQERFRFLNGGSVTAFGYYVGSYNGQTGWNGTNFTQNVVLNCVDFFHEIRLGQVWTANVTRLGIDNLTNTRLAGRSDALTLYRQAAWLTTQYAGQSNYQIGQIQATIWSLFGAGTPAPATNNWLLAAQANFASVRFENFVVVTDVNKNLANSAQEFLVYRPHVTPEPATIFLLGSGLAGLGSMARRRKRKQSDHDETV
jgi:hypothetical protein